MEKDPSSVFAKKPHRLTRRRLMKMSIAAGIPTATALALTTDDVKATDSDQVTIAFDIRGENKKQVPADWYDQFIQAKEVNKEIKRNYKAHDAVAAIGVAGGDESQVLVTLDENHPEKDNIRGDMPERKDNVPIEFEEEAWETNRVHVNDGECTPHDSECNDQTTDVSQVPGGVQTSTFLGGDCTNGPRTVAGSCKRYLFGWTTAAHCLSDGNCQETSDDNKCQDRNGCAIDTAVDIFHDGIRYGQVICVDYELDIMYIERIEGVNGTEPVPEIVLPSDHSNSVHIKDTVGESGMGTVLEENWDCGDTKSGYTPTFRGIRSCEVSDGVVRRLDTYVGDELCGVDLDQQAEMKFDNDHYAPGDSGSVGYIKDSGDYFAIGSATAQAACHACEVQWAGQGYTLQDRHNVWWSDL